MFKGVILGFTVPKWDLLINLISDTQTRTHTQQPNTLNCYAHGKTYSIPFSVTTTDYENQTKISK